MMRKGYVKLGLLSTLLSTNPGLCSDLKDSVELPVISKAPTYQDLINVAASKPTPALQAEAYKNIAHQEQSKASSAEDEQTKARHSIRAGYALFCLGALRESPADKKCTYVQAEACYQPAVYQRLIPLDSTILGNYGKILLEISHVTDDNQAKLGYLATAFKTFEDALKQTKPAYSKQKVIILTLSAITKEEEGDALKEHDAQAVAFREAARLRLAAADLTPQESEERADLRDRAGKAIFKAAQRIDARAIVRKLCEEALDLLRDEALKKEAQLTINLIKGVDAGLAQETLKPEDDTDVARFSKGLIELFSSPQGQEELRIWGERIILESIASELQKMKKEGMLKSTASEQEKLEHCRDSYSSFKKALELLKSKFINDGGFLEPLFQPITALSKEMLIPFARAFCSLNMAVAKLQEAMILKPTQPKVAFELFDVCIADCSKGLECNITMFTPKFQELLVSVHELKVQILPLPKERALTLEAGARYLSDEHTKKREFLVNAAQYHRMDATLRKDKTLQLEDWTRAADLYKEVLKLPKLDDAFKAMVQSKAQEVQDNIREFPPTVTEMQEGKSGA